VRINARESDLLRRVEDRKGINIFIKNNKTRRRVRGGVKNTRVGSGNDSKLQERWEREPTKEASGKGNGKGTTTSGWGPEDKRERKMGRINWQSGHV